MRPVIIIALSLFFIVPGTSEASLGARALFVSIIQKPPVLTSRSAIRGLIDFAQKAHMQTLFVQIYYRGQAWFPSKIVDDTPYKECLKTTKEDPLGYLIAQAHKEHMQVHAWLNLLSLGNNKNAYFIKKYGRDVLTQNLEQKTRLEDFKIDRQFFLEPGDERVGEDLSKIVKEVLAAYPGLDGIQFDYIRYPDTHPHYGYTKRNIENFKHTTGLSRIDENSVVWQNWRRANVTNLLKKLVMIARTLRPHIQVSTTGCMPLARALYEAYQDWPLWLSSGLIDFVTIMDYEPQTDIFEKRLKLIQEVTDFSKVRVALGAYKLVHTPEIFKQEFLACIKIQAAWTIFHYGSVIDTAEIYNFLTRPAHPSDHFLIDIYRR